MKLQISDTFPVSRETFEQKLFFDEDYNAELHEHLDFRSREVTERRDDGDTLRLVIEFESNEKLPWAARKLWGDFVGWREELVFFKAAHRVESRMVPRALSKQVTSTTVMHFEEPRPGQCRRSVEVEIDVSVPVVGRSIAAKMAENVRESFAKTRRFTEDYIRRHGLSDAPS